MIYNLKSKLSIEVDVYTFIQSNKKITQYKNLEEMIQETVEIINKIETFLLANHLTIKD
ncbi:hypothetical protein GCM10023345_03550 [Acinetobacter kookii]|uniref:Uncharacterized protein n=1 Tax=Acinetobacter kookii TaxID=1226327 RepID=A0A1G6K4U5_9GAMM|nr:hypothetical protein SAMN05421732_104175 [Acinetobacter kookii]